MTVVTYLPTLLKIARKMCAFIERHEDKIKQFIGTENATAVDNVLTACNALEEILVGLGV